MGSPSAMTSTYEVEVMVVTPPSASVEVMTLSTGLEVVISSSVVVGSAVVDGSSSVVEGSSSSVVVVGSEGTRFRKLASDNLRFEASFRSSQRG